MFSLTVHQRYYLYTPATDMRKGFDGLSGLVRNELEHNPLSGAVFIFLNRRRDRMKLLVWEPGGFVLFYKRLEQGTFQLPHPSDSSNQCRINWHQLVLMMEGIEMQSVKKRKRFQLPKKE